MVPWLQFLVMVWVTAAAVMAWMKADSLLLSLSCLLDLKAVTGQFQTSELNWAPHSLIASSAPAATLAVRETSVWRERYCYQVSCQLSTITMIRSTNTVLRDLTTGKYL